MKEVGRFNIEMLGGGADKNGKIWYQVLITEFPAGTTDQPELGHKCFYFSGDYRYVEDFLRTEANVETLYAHKNATRFSLGPTLPVA